nr:aspartate carbamoyltransferase [Bacilli bacterium]
MHHVISAKSFTQQALYDLLPKIDQMQTRLQEGAQDRLKGKIMAALFFEPSTRTRLSFETAMLRLGGQVISTENAREFSSAIKGETLEDTIRVVSGYADVIVIRHHEIGAAARAASVSQVPILSAGDGAGEHPSQALLDLYTIYREIGRVNDLTVTLIGDLMYGRTVHSLVYLLSNFTNIRLICTAPEATQLPTDISDYAKARGVTIEWEKNLEIAAKQADVLYQTRVQKERFTSQNEYEEVKNAYLIDTKLMAIVPQKSIIMHPLPRLNEIAKDVDQDPRAAYFRQSHYGVPVRMALLEDALQR